MIGGVDAATIEALVYGSGALGMFVGVLVVGWLLRDDALDSEAGKFRYLLVVPAFAVLAYAAMTFGVGRLTVGGVEAEIARYLDWFVTTAVMVWYVGYVVDVDRRWMLVAATFDGLFIAGGWVATMTEGTVKWTAFGGACLAFVATMYVLFQVYPRSAGEMTPERERLFLRLRNQSSVIWLVYPVVWLASGTGFGLVSTLGTVMLFTFLDVASKVPYTWVVYEHRGVFGETQLAEYVGAGGDGDVAAGSDGESPTDGPVASAD